MSFRPSKHIRPITHLHAVAQANQPSALLMLSKFRRTIEKLSRREYKRKILLSPVESLLLILINMVHYQQRA